MSQKVESNKPLSPKQKDDLKSQKSSISTNKSIPKSVSKESVKSSLKDKESVKSSLKDKESIHSARTVKSTATNTSQKALKPIEVDMDDVIFYKEHEDEFKVQRGERLIPYIIRMNERFKNTAITRQKKKKVKRGAAVFVVLVAIILVICGVIFGIQKVTGGKK